DYTACGGRQLEVHLVRRDLDDRVIGPDEVPDLDVPFEDRPLADRLASRRGDDVDDLISRRGHCSVTISSARARGDELEAAEEGRDAAEHGDSDRDAQGDDPQA